MAHLVSIGDLFVLDFIELVGLFTNDANKCGVHVASVKRYARLGVACTSKTQPNLR